MVEPDKPRNVRVVYPDGEEIPIAEVVYRGCVNGWHVWQARQWVKWSADAVIQWDGPTDNYYVFPGWETPPPGADLSDWEGLPNW